MSTGTGVSSAPWAAGARGESLRRRTRRRATEGASATPAASGADSDAAHPLEESGRLAWQASAAVGLLERFGDLLTVALEAVGSGDDEALDAALAERERLVAQLEPLLAALAAARESASAWVPPRAGDDAAASRGASASRAAIAVILRPVNEALRHAQHLHLRLTDEVRGREARRHRTEVVAPIVLVR